MALDVRETYLRDCSVHSYFSRVLLDALSVPPLGQVFWTFRRVREVESYAPSKSQPLTTFGDRQNVEKTIRTKLDFFGAWESVFR